jgi:hypothetical protein
MNLFKKNKNQTQRQPRLSGRSRTALSTYYRSETSSASKSPFRTPPVKRSARRFVFGFLDIIILGLLLAGVIYSLLINPEPKLLISSAAYRDKADYQIAADQIFSDLKNRNKLTFSEDGVVKELKNKFPEISGASVELPFFSQRPTLRLAIAKPSLLLVNGGQSYVIDSDGIVTGKQADVKNAAGLAKVTDQSGFLARAGRPALSSNDVNFINILVSELKRAKVPIASLTLPPAAEELDLRAADQGYYVKFFLGGEVLRQAGQYLAARHNFQQKGSPPDEYLDVRVPGKIFYK